MSALSLTLAPSHYYGVQSTDWVFGPNTDLMSFTINGPQPTISRYIAYDTLNPPNPFIAVTQDGLGNVVYDGGFPKFYNHRAPAANATFAQLDGSFKYLFNALTFVSNKAKVASGNRRILLIGDRLDNNYNVLLDNTSGFRTSFTRLCNIANFQLTIKRRDQWAGGRVNASLEELEQYCLVIVMSSEYVTNPNITDACVTNLVQYRENGNGLIIITDHGGRNIPSLEEAVRDSTGFYSMANKIVTNFGVYFTGNYNRSPVNVGFIRNTYGDHPLYNNLGNNESIHAGGSESEVRLATFQYYNRNNAPTLNFDQVGRYIVRTLAVNTDGSMEINRFVYTIIVGDILFFKTREGRIITETEHTFKNFADFMVDIQGQGLGSLSGVILKNGIRIGEIMYDESSGSRENWYSGTNRFIPVKAGDEFEARIEVPFQYSKTLSVRRFQPVICPNVDLGRITRDIRGAEFLLVKPKEAYPVVVNAINDHMAHLDLPYRHSYPKDSNTLRDYFCDRMMLPSTSGWIYSTSALTQQALRVVRPPTIQEIFNTWDRFDNDSFFPRGQGATSAAGAWFYDSQNNRIVQPINQTRNYSGFLSDERLEYYEHDVTLQSLAGDDDLNSVILAFVRIGNLNHVLTCAATRGGVPPAVSHSVLVDSHTSHNHGGPGAWQNTGRNKIIRQNNFAGTDGVSNSGSGWQGRFTRIYVTREGDKFTILASRWNDRRLVPESRMEFDLNEDPILHKFKGPQQFGYGNFSQASSFFTNIELKGGILWNMLVDASQNVVYRWINGSWRMLPGVTAQDVFGSPRIVRGLEDQQDFLLNIDGTITTLG